jgi:hypothetical protein
MRIHTTLPHILLPLYVLGNDDGKIVGQDSSCLTGQLGSMFLWGVVADPEGKHREGGVGYGGHEWLPVRLAVAAWEL